MIVLLALIPPILILLWLLRIRPYCIRHGKGYTPGYTWFATMWVDWQEAGELSRKRGDRGMILSCRVFLVLGAVFVFIPIIGLALSLLA